MGEILVLLRRLQTLKQIEEIYWIEFKKVLLCHLITKMRNVFIIVRCLKLELRRTATLVFDTIRIGFPTFKISCHYLGDFQEVEDEVIDKCLKNDIQYIFGVGQFKYNGEVIEKLVNEENT